MAQLLLEAANIDSGSCSSRTQIRNTGYAYEGFDLVQADMDLNSYVNIFNPYDMYPS
jgi:hypothetical protein